MQVKELIVLIAVSEVATVECVQCRETGIVTVIDSIRTTPYLKKTSHLWLAITLTDMNGI